ncbi:MAG: hypothetical protein KAW88_01990 [Candidatus Cloacimonetes bacterium]|nr:hypothetical protein [Candidatus Cloacimonadota bacterium]
MKVSKFGPEGIDNLGLMNIAISGSYPISDMMTTKAILGYLNSSVEKDGESNMGMEADLGITCNIYEGLTFDLVGAVASVNEDFFEESDTVYEVASRFQYKF